MTTVIIRIEPSSVYSERVAQLREEINKLVQSWYIGMPKAFSLIICIDGQVDEVEIRNRGDLARLGYVPAGPGKSPPLPYSSPG